MATCFFTITVNDREPPLVRCQSRLDRMTDTNQSFAILSPDPVATHDNSGSAHDDVL